MTDSEKLGKICALCGVEFCSVYTKKRHLRNMHNVDIPLTTRRSRIICPLCSENEINCGTHSKLQMHLELEHGIKLKIETHNFSDPESYDHWFESNKLKKLYCIDRGSKGVFCAVRYYSCNRSNAKGFESKRCKRREKKGGSIKMYGICPSRIETKFYKTGQTIVKFCTTHVGHEQETTKDYLSKRNNKNRTRKPNDGFTVEANISDAIKYKSEKLQQNVLADPAVEPSMELPAECEAAGNEEIQRKGPEIELGILLNKQATREEMLKEHEDFLRSLDEETFERFMSEVKIIMKKYGYNAHEKELGTQIISPTRR